MVLSLTGVRHQLLLTNLKKFSLVLVYSVVLMVSAHAVKLTSFSRLLLIMFLVCRTVFLLCEVWYPS